MSDWSKRPLSAAQIRYAAEDVELLDPLWRALSAALDAKGRTTLAAAASEEERLRARDVPGDDDAWQQIGAGTALEGVELAVLQELAAWREEQARIHNQPPRTVLADGALVDLARRQPITPESVLASRRLPKGLVRSAEELAERIARAQRRPSWGWPTRIRRGTPEATVSALLQVFAAAYGEANGFAGPLALPAAISDRIALTELHDRTGLHAILGAWRDALIGDALWSALQGEIALHVTPGTRRALRWEPRPAVPKKKI
jgi:ribonuclease D